MAFGYKAYKESQDVVNARKKKEAAEAAYKQSSAVNTALADYDRLKAARPKEVNVNNFSYADQLKSITNDILNRKPFEYDLNADMLYQQYKDQYINGGRLAMADTMGQAQAATGGYGNSYAQSVGQQAYQGYLNGLNERIPELYNLAMQRYEMEGDELGTRYGLLSDRYGTEYGEYRDRVGDYNTDVDRAYDRYNTERNFDYGKYADDRSYYASDYADTFNRDYGMYGDAYDRALAEYKQGYSEGQDAMDRALKQAQLDEDKRQFDAKLTQSGAGTTGGVPTRTGADITKSIKESGYSADKVYNALLDAYNAADNNLNAKSAALDSVFAKYPNLSEEDKESLIAQVFDNGDEIDYKLKNLSIRGDSRR